MTIAADFGDGNLYITPPDDAHYDLLEQLGMNTAPEALAGVEQLSFEQVDQLNAVDVVFWITLPEATVAADPLYLAQPIHTEGRDIFPGEGTELGLSLTFGTVLSIPYTIEHLFPCSRRPSTATPPQPCASAEHLAGQLDRETAIDRRARPKARFHRASTNGIGLTIEVPDESLMALSLNANDPLPGGPIRYATAFGI